MSFRFVGLRKAAIGGSWMGFLHLTERCTLRSFRRMLEMLGSAWLYVRTNRILSVSVFLFWRFVSACGIDVFFRLDNGSFYLLV